MKRLIPGILFMTLLVSGCMKNNDSPACNFDPCSYVVPAAEIQQVQTYLTNNSIDAVQHCSGMFYKIVTPGTGKSAQVCSTVAVKYIGKLTNGNVFEDQTASPVVFDLGNLITAWKIGIPLIKEGGKVTLYIPPSLGYGSQANGPIPANSILIFDIELVAVQ